MRAEEWEEVKEIVDRALKLPEEDRSAYLASIEDETIRQSAEGLLKVSPTEADAFDRVRFFPTGRDIPYAPGDTVGPYTILNAVERGGMGAVFEARDGRNERVVALKILPPSAFPFSRNEDKAQARLTHRYIAALYESGTTPEGFRYVAMEYVEGVPINAFAAEHCPTVRSRLKLFNKVCEAVEYAHQKLVVHRDLKPDNILVTQTGDPKLLDFGIAKILRPDLALATLTRSAERPFTLAYASPEQLGGDYTDTRTDIYSLGVLLCLLLTGRLPYKTENSHELPQAIRKLEPVRPSALLSDEPSDRSRPEGNPRQLRRLLEGELDAIILRALRKKPDERYRSVAELAEDVRRYLDHEPVLALKGNRRYRTRKFIERHRVSTVIGGLALIILIGFTAALYIFEREAVAQRDLARREAKRATTVSGFLVDMFKVSNPWTTLGQTFTAREVLDDAVLKLKASPPSDPVIRGTLMRSLGKIHLNLGLYSPAEALLQPSLRDLEANDKNNRALLAETSADLATALYHRARYGEAERFAARALSIDGAMHDRTRALDVSSLLGRIAFARGNFRTAEKVFREADTLAAAQFGKASLRRASAQNDLAAALQAQGQYAEAESLYDRSLAVRRQLLGDGHPAVLQVLHNLACLYQDRGETARAQTLFQKIRLGYRIISEANYPSVPTLFHNMGSALLSAGKLDDADELLSDSLEGYRALVPDEHPYIARALAEKGRLAYLRGNDRDAEKYYQDGFTRLEGSLGKDHPDTITVGNNVAALYAHEGRRLEAKALWQELLLRIAAHPVRRDLDAITRDNLTALLQEKKGGVRPYATAGIEMLDLAESPDFLALPSGQAVLSSAGGASSGGIRFYDAFTGSAIDPRKWEWSGGTVKEEGGELHIVAAITDRGGKARTLPFRTDPTRPITISRRVKIHAANQFFNGLMIVGPTGYPEKRFGVSYANYHYTGAGECVTVGFSLFRHNANSHKFAERLANASPLISPLWDRWFDEELRYDPRTGEVHYSIDGTERLAYNVGPLPPNASSMTLTFSTWGWYTGHSQEMDWVRVEQ
jgi:serine/threonine protein kinase